MSLSGNLQDVSIADIMQFIHLGERTGTLSVKSPEGDGTITFHRGWVVHAQAPSSTRLTAHLIDRGLITEQDAERAALSQREVGDKRPIGHHLLGNGALTKDQLNAAIQTHIEQAIYELAVWSRGDFNFNLDDLRPLDDAGLDPSEIIPSIRLNTQVVLLEAMRLFDERNRSGSGGAKAVESHLRGRSATTMVAPPITPPGNGLNGSRAEPPPEAPSTAALDLEAEVDPKMERCIKTLKEIEKLEGEIPLQTEEDLTEGERGHLFHLQKLRRVVVEMRSGLVSATVALSLMNVISESVERAILFAVRPSRLVALGAFGATRDGKPLAQVTAALSIPLEMENVLSLALQKGRIATAAFEQSGMDPEFRRLIGAPQNPQVVAFPVVGQERAVLIIYADNGFLDAAIDEVDVIGLAASQAGLAFENEILRRELEESRRNRQA